MNGEVRERGGRKREGERRRERREGGGEQEVKEIRMIHLISNTWIRCYLIV